MVRNQTSGIGRLLTKMTGVAFNQSFNQDLD